MRSGAFVLQGFASQVSRRDDRRGRELAEAGQVEIVSVDGNEIEAIVKDGPHAFAVLVSVSGAAVEASCDCPSLGSACAHIWSTLLTADFAGLLDAGVGAKERSASGDADDYGVFSRADAGDGSAADARRDPRSARPTAAKPSGLDALRRLSRSGEDPWEELATSDTQLVFAMPLARAAASGRLSVELKQRARKQGGDWAKPRAFRATRHAIAEVPEAGDREILSLLLGAESAQLNYTNPSGAAEFVLPPHGARLLVEKMCATGRLFALQGSSLVEPALSWDSGPPWRLELAVTVDGAPATARLTARLRRGEAARDVREFALLHSGGLAFCDSAVAQVDFHGAFAVVAHLRHTGTVEVPADRLNELIDLVLALPGHAAIDLPEPWRQFDATPPQPCLRAATGGRAAGERVGCRIVLDYGAVQVDAGAKPRRLVSAGDHHVLRRDLETEHRAVQTLLDLGARCEPSWRRDDAPLSVPAARFPSLVRELLQLGWRVEADGRALRRATGFSLSVGSGQDWFELRGGVAFGGQPLPLPELLAAARRGETAVLLDDGSTGLLPEEWLQRVGMLARLGKAANGGIRFERGQAWVLDALLLAQPDIAVDAVFANLRAKLAAFGGIVPVHEPATFRGSLRSYQRDALGWFRYLREFGFGGCLADDMGLGKTVQVLALLEERRPERRGPSLAVVPKSLVFNWREEALRFAPELRVIDHVGNERKQRLAEIVEADLVLTTYGVLRRDILELKEIAFDYVILDEAHLIKNAATQAAKATRLLQAEHRLALSGTPIENRLDDLWSLFEFLNRGMLGSARVFQEITRQGGLDQSGRALITRAVRPFLLRRTKEQVLAELPPRTEQVLWCEMGDEQRRQYTEARDHFRSSLLHRVAEVGLERSKIQVLEALLRLRQIACHPGLIDPARHGDDSVKLEVLMARLHELAGEGHKTLVFSQFTKLLGLVRQRLDADRLAHEYLDGRTRDRKDRIERFHRDAACKVFLLSLKVGGVGLNLTAAGYVFLLDPWWNPAVEAQAIDRAHRIGQSKPVVAYRLICKDTVEEKILELQRTKRELAASVIEADADVLRRLTGEDLEVLLS